MSDVTNSPRAYTVDEVRAQFLLQLRTTSAFWAKQDGTIKENMDGLCFSILNIFDGTSLMLPSIDLVLRPHATDQETHTAAGENWYQDGQVINPRLMHEEWYK